MHEAPFMIFCTGFLSFENFSVALQRSVNSRGWSVDSQSCLWMGLGPSKAVGSREPEVTMLTFVAAANTGHPHGSLGSQNLASFDVCVAGKCFAVAGTGPFGPSAACSWLSDSLRFAPPRLASRDVRGSRDLLYAPPCGSRAVASWR